MVWCFAIAADYWRETASRLDGPGIFSARDISIPGDISSAAYFVAAAALLPNSELLIENVGLNPTRTEFLSTFKSLGLNIEAGNTREESNEPVGNITCQVSLKRFRHKQFCPELRARK